MEGSDVDASVLARVDGRNVSGGRIGNRLKKGDVRVSRIIGIVNPSSVSNDGLAQWSSFLVNHFSF